MRLRRGLRAELGEVGAVLETHGGYGHLWQACYADVPAGVVFDKAPEKAEALALQRPTWRVYEADCITALGAGVGAGLPVTLVDVDPYGQPWPVIDALLAGWRDVLPDRWGIAVHDGLRHRLKIGVGYATESLRTMLVRYGTQQLYTRYLDVCADLLTDKLAAAGFALTRWSGFYSGDLLANTHYAAVCKRVA